MSSPEWTNKATNTIPRCSRTSTTTDECFYRESLPPTCLQHKSNIAKLITPFSKLGANYLVFLCGYYLACPIAAGISGCVCVCVCPSLGISEWLAEDCWSCCSVHLGLPIIKQPGMNDSRRDMMTTILWFFSVMKWIEDYLCCGSKQPSSLFCVMRVFGNVQLG